jgi:hypothetical protein
MQGKSLSQQQQQQQRPVGVLMWRGRSCCLSLTGLLPLLPLLLLLLLLQQLRMRLLWQQGT